MISRVARLVSLWAVTLIGTPMKTIFVLLAILVFMTSVRGESPAWPQFRGPGATGIAEDEKPPVEIGSDKNVKWKVAAPAGLSSPIIVGERLIITAFDGGKLYAIAYNRADGSEIWRAEAHAEKLEPYHPTEGSPAASTPATDGERIVSYFGSCGLFCYDLSGKELWKYELPPAGTAADFGSGVSPILADGTVVLVRDETKGSKILALDAATGKPKWEKQRQSPISYSTPVVWDTPAGKQVVAAGHARMIAYDLANGAEKWSVNGIPSGCIASPVIAEGKLFFAGTGGTDDPDFKMPTFDGLLKDLDKNKDGALGRDEGEKAYEGFFDSQDTNKDNQITRDEFETIIKFMSEGKNVAFALSAGGTGDVTDSHMLWKKTRGLPYVP